MSLAGRIAVGTLLAVTPACAMPQAVPGHLFVVINDTKQAQTCAIKSEGTKWSRWFKLASKANLQQSPSVDELYFQCRPPVRQVRYTLHPEKRYVLLRARGEEVELVEVTTGAHP